MNADAAESLNKEPPGTTAPLRLPWILRIVLLVGIGIQGFHFFADTVEPWFWKLAASRWDTSRERSAEYSLGQDAASYIRFVNRVAPESAPILLPDKRSDAPFTFTNRWWMQYFFFPKTVFECNSPPADPCATRLNAPDILVLVLGKFPPGGTMTADKPLTVWPGEATFEGIFYGESLEVPDLSPEQLTVRERVSEVGLTFLIVVLLTLTGGMITLSIRDVSLVNLAAVAFPIGLGVITYAAFLASWASIPLTSITFLTAMIGSMLVSLVWFIRSGGARRFSGRLSNVQFKPSPRLLLGSLPYLLCGALLVVVGGLSVGKSYTLTDPIQSWAQKGYAISHFQTIFAAQDWGTLGLAYPINVPLAISVFHSIGGDVGPGSKVIFPLFGVSLLLSLLYYWRTRGLNPLDGVLGVLLVGTVPVILHHMTRGMANLPFAAYFVGGALLLIRSIKKEDSGFALLAGLMFGLSAWTRVEGFAYSLILAAALFVFQSLRQVSWRLVASFMVPLLLLSLPWWLFSSTFVGETYVSSAPSSFLSSILGGNLNPGALLTILTAFSSHIFAWQPASEAWGAFFFFAIACLLIGGYRSIRHKRTPEFLPILAWAVVLGCTVGVFYMWSFDRTDLFALIDRSFDRALIPAAALFAAFALPFVIAPGRARESDNHDHSSVGSSATSGS